MIKKLSVSLASVGLFSAFAFGAVPTFADTSQGTEQVGEEVETKEELLKMLQEEYGTEDRFYLEFEDDEYKEEINPVTGMARTTNKKTGETEEYEAFGEFELFTKEEFLKSLQEEYGTEDKFFLEYEDDQTKEEINPITGMARITDKEKGTIEEYDAFKALETVINDKLLQTLQEEYGTENRFYLVYEDEEIKEEINPVTGMSRLTDKESGEVDELSLIEETEVAGSKE